MLTQHDCYEELCALAVSGQIAPGEMLELKKHLQTCGECRHTLSDFTHIAAQILPEFAAVQSPLEPPAGMAALFIARAHSEGIPLQTKKTAHRVGDRKWLLYPACAAAGAAAVLILMLSIKVANRQRQPVANGIDATGAQTAHADRSGTDSELTNLKQLEGLRTQVAQLTAERRQTLESAHSERLQAGARLAILEKANEQLNRDLEDRNAQVEQLTADAARVKSALDKLTSAKAEQEFLIQADEAELNKLRENVSSLTEQLDESEHLSAAANQAKDLIVARNLHIIDVDDSDGNGRRQRPFGRIFYTEGKNLVFYAYDLDSPRKLNAKINFYVWGSQEGVNKPVHSLGIFQSDDAKEGRWVLKFDDPRVLAQINCVFVTAESGMKDIKQPRGHQILFASLGSTNHP